MPRIVAMQPAGSEFTDFTDFIPNGDKGMGGTYT
jgi:hypothetical protein